MNMLGKLYCAVRDKVRRAEPSESERMVNDFLQQLESDNLPETAKLVTNILEYSANKIPYYLKLARDKGLSTASIDQWPALTKNIIRSNFEDLKDPELESRNHWLHASGGSTGKPIYVVHDDMFGAWANATRKFAAKAIFGGPFTNQVILWGCEEDMSSSSHDCNDGGSLKSWLLKKMGLKTSTFNSYNLTAEKLAACAKTIIEQKPDFIFGYAASIFQLAKYMDANGIRVKKAPKVVMLTAQTCYPYMREMIDKVFRCYICNHYGSREVGPVIWESAAGDLCVCDKFDYVEVVDDNNRPLPPGQEGRILVTTLHNYAMPLIRYDIGDRGIAGEPVIVNGRKFSTIQKIIGKVTEDFIGDRGQLVSGIAFTKVFFFRDWLDEYQIVQKKLDLVEILYVPFSDVEKKEFNEIEEEVRKLIGENCKVTWNKVDEIPKTGAGKHLYVRCLVSDEEKQRLNQTTSEAAELA